MTFLPLCAWNATVHLQVSIITIFDNSDSVRKPMIVKSVLVVGRTDAQCDHGM